MEWRVLGCVWRQQLHDNKYNVALEERKIPLYCYSL